MAEIDYTIEINPITNYTIELNEQGPQGARGYDGVGISSIDETSSQGLVDTYTITLDDGRTSNFNVTNGFSPTATVTKAGTVATITITDENGTTTANVYDGNGSVDDVRVNGISVVNEGIAEIQTTNTYDSSSVAPISGMGVADAGFITGIDNSDVTTALGYTPADEDLSNLSETGQEIIDSKADVDLSNLSSTGQGILDNKLNQQQVTNCLLEVPQNIKLELNNGTLTLKAGSKVIVPNGFEQDGITPKFDEVIIESDITNSETQSGVKTVMIWLTNTRDSIGARNITNCYSGSTRPSGQTSMTWYNTNNNIMEKTTNGGSTWSTGQSFPLCIATMDSTGFTSINQIFNGFGYIGSTIWADKGIKCLIPNGRNADGSLNNIEHTLSKLSIRNVTGDTNKTLHINGNCPEFSDMLGLTNSELIYYDAEKNYNCHVENNTIVTYQDSICGSINVTSGVITSFTVQNALNINSMCDGQWVNSSLTLASGATYPTTNDTIYDISSYLPNDGYDYEVMLTGYVVTGATSGNYVHLDVYTDALASYVRVCAAQTRTSSTVLSAGNAVVPVSTGRIIKVFAYSGYQGKYYLNLVAYRRLGTNV